MIGRRLRIADKFSAEWLPDAAAVRAGVCRLHREAQTGRGVTLALVDTGVTAGVWFTDRGFRLSGDAPGSDADHGTAMAAVIFSIAPDVHVRSYRVGDDPEVAFRSACASAADLVVAAWGTADVPAPEVDASRCITVRNPGRPRDWPGCLLDTHAVIEPSWPAGPFQCDAVSRPFEGLSAVVAVAAGVAALLIGLGASPSEAARLAVAAQPGQFSAVPNIQHWKA